METESSAQGKDEYYKIRKFDFLDSIIKIRLL